MLQRLVVLGGSGDLTRRYLLPALAELHAAGRLPDGFEVVAADRDDLGTDGYREAAAGWLAEHAPAVAPAARQALAPMLVHRQADATDADSVGEVLEPRRGPAAVYLALPPAVFEATIAALTRAGGNWRSGSCGVGLGQGDDLAKALSTPHVADPGSRLP